MTAGDGSVVSVRLPGELLAAVRKLAEGNGETVSDTLRQGALMRLGICPTCGQRAPAPDSPVTGEIAARGDVA